MADRQPNDGVFVFGVRHHGPGSAHSLRRALAALAPDIVLVEGPPDADGLLTWAADPHLEPPVALLIYRPDAPSQAAVYPFAVFSPEWQAIQYALAAAIPVRFMDLPQAHQIALLADEFPRQNSAAEPPSIPVPPSDPPNAEPPTPNAQLPPPPDLLTWIAQAAGFDDGERWWERQIELRRDSHALFDAILELSTVLREELNAGLAMRKESPANIPTLETRRFENQREAYMRRTIRKAQAAGFRRIAVVCGAWHAPALAYIERYPAKADDRLLKGLPKVKVAAAWAPWSHGRLCWQSGYGAGVEAPGWYAHLWQAHAAGWPPQETAARWLSHAAALLRAADLHASSAQVIEALRLAEALAALRGQPLPGLAELNEAVQAVFLQGEALPLALLHEPLFLAERLGKLPDAIPLLPIQADLQAQQKRLRLPPEAGERTLDLDLRNVTDRERSHLLHRLSLLDIPWGKPQEARGKLGTFHELWRLQWRPELAVQVVEAGLWGNTVADAATAFALHTAQETLSLPSVTGLIQTALLADLPEAVAGLVARLQDIAALSSDVGELMEALPALARAMRYGSVRQTDTGMIAGVVGGLLARVSIGLPPACVALDDDAAAQMAGRIGAVHQGVLLLQSDEYWGAWREALVRLAGQAGLHGVIAGRVCRLLLDRKVFSPQEAARRMGLALSAAVPALAAAAWLEGFLKDSGAILVHDRILLEIVDGWVTSLSAERFLHSLPALRRTFAGFTPPERRQIGERVRQEVGQLIAIPTAPPEFDPQRAAQVIPVLAMILGRNISQEACNG